MENQPDPDDKKEPVPTEADENDRTERHISNARALLEQARSRFEREVSPDDGGDADDS